MLASLAIAAARARGHIDEAEEKRLCTLLLETPRHMVAALAQSAKIEALGRKIAEAQDVLYLGRGVHFPLALEGALKLKEISYIHAEGYAAGEMKHGPIALIDKNVPVIVLAPYDALFEKTVSNMHEVMARGGRVVLISDKRGLEAGGRRHLGPDRSARRRSLHRAAALLDSRSSCSPITPPSPKAPTSTSRATSPNPSPSSDRTYEVCPDWASAAAGVGFTHRSFSGENSQYRINRSLRDALNA